MIVFNLVLIAVSIIMVIAVAKTTPVVPGMVGFTIFWVGGTILWTCRHLIGIAFSTHRIKKLDREIAASDTQAAQAEKERQQAQQAEIAALPPVARMTARIETNKMSVSLYLQLSEAERATVIQYELDQVVFEDSPKWDKEDIASAKISGEESVKSIRGYSEQKILEREIAKQANESHLEYMKTERQKVRLIDYMAYPYTRTFKTIPEATQYAAKLKEILPKIKELVDQHATHQSSETIEL